MNMELGTTHLRVLQQQIAAGSGLKEALASSIGNTVACDAQWRFFGETLPECGVERWNEGSLWKQHWKPFLPTGFFSFGEDVFGNQLVFASGQTSVQLWNHENGEMDDLLLDAMELLSTLVENGIEWIDFYQDGSLAIAREFGSIPTNCHLHWTTPLILGGAIIIENISVVEREQHLVGHAKLWRQIQGLEPGNMVKPGDDNEKEKKRGHH